MNRNADRQRRGDRGRKKREMSGKTDRFQLSRKETADREPGEFEDEATHTLCVKSADTLGIRATSHRAE